MHHHTQKGTGMTTTSAAEAGPAGLREELDGIDLRPPDTLKARIEVCARIAEHKREHDVPTRQPHRIGVTQERAARCGAADGIDDAFPRRPHDLTTEETRRVEAPISEGASTDRRPATDRPS